MPCHAFKTFYFPIFLCVHRALSVRSLAFSVHRVITVHSQSVHRSYRVFVWSSSSSFIFIQTSKVKGSVIASLNKIGRNACVKMKGNLHFISIGNIILTRGTCRVRNEIKTKHEANRNDIYM